MATGKIKPETKIDRPIGIAARSVQHVTINVTDVRRARHFYGDILGLVEVPRPAWFAFKGAWFAIGQQQLHLVHADPLPPRTKEHFCLEVDDLAAARAHLEAREIACKPDRDIHGVRRFVVHDPDGNYVEVAEIKTPWPTQWPAEPLPDHMRAAME